MRRIVTIIAGAALALALVGPAVAGATDKSTQGSTITAQHARGGHDGGHWGRDRHDHGRYHRGGGCYGCYGRGSYCNRYGCAYPYYGYPYGYYYGGYGCNYDYPCGPPYYEYNCTRYRDRSGHAYQDPQCKWDDKCQCYYHSSQPPSGSEKQGPPPDQNAQPAPNQGQQPPPDQGMQPGPSQGQQPPPDQGGNQPRPY